MASLQEEMVLARLRMALSRLVDAVEAHDSLVDDDEEIEDALRQARQALNNSR